MQGRSRCRRRTARLAAGGPVLALAAVAAAGCDPTPAPRSTFYEERIAPTLEVGCVQQTTGCHLASERGTATGNLDLSSFDALQQRRDVLPAYGPYPLGLLLLKGGGDATVSVETFDPPPGHDAPFVDVETDIKHNAGRGISLGSEGFAKLKQWIEAGATRDGVPPEELAESLGSCTKGPGQAPGFDPSAEPTPGGLYDRFVREVQPVLRSSCAGSRCHGSRIADFHLSCGETREEKRWNYFAVLEFIDDPASSSELLDRPLSMLRGGTYHEGGNVFASPEDEDYKTLRAFAEKVVSDHHGLIEVDVEDEGLRFFANRVQPALVRKGCMFLNCHSPSMFHELRLRGGSGGNFSRLSTLTNYRRSKLQLALESPNPNESRLIAKNLFPRGEVPGAEGLRHRGGALLEDFGPGIDRATPDDCEGVDAEEGDLNEVPAYCVLLRWFEIERQKAIDEGEVFADTVRSVFWVERPPGIGDVRSFDTFRGGADLRFATTSVTDGALEDLGTGMSALGGCGLGSDPDIRSPAVSWDGTRVAFAARSSGSEPLRLYWMDLDGAGAPVTSSCEPIADIAPATDRAGGILTHDFDPAFAPDGRLMFASTRGNLEHGRDYGGPTRTPAAMQPNANMYMFDPSGGSVRQMTYLLNQELDPSLMADGRAIFTTEKRQPQFHQLALRRQNPDGGDYHPLFAQRGSVGFRSATGVVEMPNRNLAFIGGPLDSDDGAGAVVLANRSIGPDQDDRRPDDRSYIHAMTLPAGGGAFGNIQDVPVYNDRDRGAYRSPARLPTGRLLVSCALGAGDLSSGPYPFQLCELNPDTGAVREVGGAGGRANVDAAAVYARPSHEMFESRLDEPNGATRLVEGEGDAVVHMLDFPLLETLLFANTRTGLPIDPNVGGFDVYEVQPPPPGATSFGDLPGDKVVSDDYGRMYKSYDKLGHVPLNADGSAKIRIPGGTPVLMRVTDSAGEPLMFDEDDPFEGVRFQKEQMQFYPGERIRQSFPRHLFNGMCAGCHGSITGDELDQAVDVDILTSASQTRAKGQSPLDLR